MTLTREQVIEMAREAGALVPDDPSESWIRRQTIAMNLAYSAGRAAGLGEAVVVCEQRARIHSDSADTWSAWGGVTETAGAVSRRDEATNCAAAIEQLKEQSK